MKPDESPFFIGYLPAPKRLAGFLMVCILSLLAGFLGAGLVTGAAQDDPGDGDFRFDLGRQTVTGRVELKPYPLIRVTAGNEHIAAGHTLMLTGQGKRGVLEQATSLDGRPATVSGVLLKRGDLDMLQVAGGADGLVAADGDAAPVAARQPLGRWRIAGEICDGKCLAGAMRPGRGIAHRACANLCLIGGVPPVFVSAAPVAGHSFFLVAGPDGGPMPDALLDHVGAYVLLEGDIEMAGDLPILRIDPATVELAP